MVTYSMRKDVSASKMKPKKIGKSRETWKRVYSVMSLCSCVSNSHKFPAEFRWLSAPPFQICINFLSNFFVAAPVEKVEFLWWQDWLPIIRRRINFPIGARNQLNLLLLLGKPSIKKVMFLWTLSVPPLAPPPRVYGRLGGSFF